MTSVVAIVAASSVKTHIGTGRACETSPSSFSRWASIASWRNSERIGGGLNGGPGSRRGRAGGAARYALMPATTRLKPAST